MTDRTPDMRRALGAKLRRAFQPVAASGTAIDAEIAARLAVLDETLAARPRAEVGS